MLERILFTTTVLSGLVLFTMQAECLADASAQLELAQAHKQQGYHPKAESVYQKILTDYPGTQEAFVAQKNLVKLYCRIDKYDHAQRALGSLIEDFSDHPGLLDALYDIVDKYRFGWSNGLPGDSVEAWNLQHQLQQYPNSLYADKGQLAVPAINVIVRIGIDGGAAAVEKLIGDFSAHPDLPRALWYIADKYKTSKMYKEARAVYKAIATDRPDSNYAPKAQLAVPVMDVLGSIESGQDANAQAAIDTLISGFSGHPDLPSAIQSIAAQYKKAKEYDRSERLHRQITTNHPATDYALKSQRELVTLYLLMQKDAEAQQALAKLLIDFTEHSDTPAELSHIAKQYEELSKYEQAKTIYKQIIQRYPDSPYAAKAKLDIPRTDILSLVHSDQNTQVQKAIDRLIVDFSDSPYMASAVFNIAGKYYVLGKYDDAIATYQRVVETGSKSESAVAAQGQIAWTYFKQGLYDNAIEAWRKVLDDFPESADLPSARYWVAQSYFKKRVYHRAIEEYQKVVEMHPGSREAVYSQRKIALIHLQLGQHDRATAKYRKVVENYPESGWDLRAQTRLAQSYYAKRDLDQALKEYQKLLKMRPDPETAAFAQKQIDRIKIEKERQRPQPNQMKD